MLDESSLANLAKDAVKVDVSLRAGVDCIRAESFTLVSVTITNRLARRIDPIVRLIATAPTTTTDASLLDNVIISDGTWTASPRSRTLPHRGSHSTYTWNVTFLSPGKYAFLVVVQEASASALADKPDRLAFVSSPYPVDVLPSA